MRVQLFMQFIEQVFCYTSIALFSSYFFVTETVIFRVVINRDKFCSENIQSKAFSFIKKVFFNDILDIRAKKRVKYSMNNEYIL